MTPFSSRLATAFGPASSKVWRAFLTAVPARLFGVVTIPLVGWVTGAYQVSGVPELLRAVAMYSALGFAWALLIEFQWPRIKKMFAA